MKPTARGAEITRASVRVSRTSAAAAVTIERAGGPGAPAPRRHDEYGWCGTHVHCWRIVARWTDRYGHQWRYIRCEECGAQGRQRTALPGAGFAQPDPYKRRRGDRQLSGALITRSQGRERGRK